jgi:hypothetical protein
MQIPSSHPHVVLLPISRASLGWRFERVFHACRQAACALSGGDCRIGAVRDGHERVGYRFAFRDAMTALRLAAYHQSVVRRRPSSPEGRR